jgi:urea transporter
MNNTTTGNLQLPTEVLKGISQIMLQENIYTGILFTVGIFFGSLSMGIGVLLATLAGTLTAKALKYDKNEIAIGLYGFSPALVGVALTFLFKNEIIIWLAVIVGGSAAAIIQHFFIKRKIAVFTFPFILVSWILVYTLHSFTSIQPSEALAAIPQTTKADSFFVETNSYSEVIFQANVWAGILFFIAVFLSSPIAALYGFVGAAIGNTFSLAVHESGSAVHMGLFGFNAVLCAIAFAGNKKIDGVWVFVSVLLCAYINTALVNADINLLKTAGGVFTFPFVFASCLILVIKNFVDRKTNSN